MVRILNMASTGVYASPDVRFVIISDSRGKTLERFFPDNMLNYIDIRHYNGLSLNTIKDLLPKWTYIGPTLYDRLKDGLHPRDVTQIKIVGYLRQAILKDQTC